MKTSDHRIEHILQRMLADRTPDAPAEAVKWAKDLYRTRAAEQPKGVLQRLIAVVTADIAPGRLAFGERSGTAGQARQMLFEAGENAIDLRVTDVNGRFDIRGQILGEDFHSADAKLAGAAARLTTSADENAMFSFNGVTAGEYSLTISGEAAEIVIERLMLK